MKMFTFISLLFLTSIFALSGKEALKESQTVNSGEEVSPIILFKDMEQVMELAENKPTVLFFKANWCPSCISAAKEFEKDIDKIKGINLVIVDYDNSKELQVKYGVTYQHTFVQISSSGEAIVKWNGGAVSRLLKTIDKDAL